LGESKQCLFCCRAAGRTFPQRCSVGNISLKKGFPQTGKIDGDFGEKTEKATRFFQVAQGLKASGSLDNATLDAARALGYTVLPDNYYKNRSKPEWPSKPRGTESPSNVWRNKQFKCFKFTQLARKFRGPYAESIVIGGSCDGRYADWIKRYIVEIDIKQLGFAIGYPGYVRCHRIAADYFVALFEAWETADLLHLTVRYEGASSRGTNVRSRLATRPSRSGAALMWTGSAIMRSGRPWI
jgi:hypothetical protein